MTDTSSSEDDFEEEDVQLSQYSLLAKTKGIEAARGTARTLVKHVPSLGDSGNRCTFYFVAGESFESHTDDRVIRLRRLSEAWCHAKERGRLQPW